MIVVFCCLASMVTAEPNSLAGGDFESADAAGAIKGWYVVPGSDVQRLADGGNHFARLRIVKADTTSLIQRELPIPAGWKAVTLSARVRYANVAAGKKSWNDARIQLMFVDDQRKTIGRPAVMNWTGTAKDWQSQSVTGTVPAGATKIKIQIGLFDAKSGSLDVDDVALAAAEPAEAGSGPAAGPKPAAAATTQPLPYAVLRASFADAQVEGKSVAGWHIVNGRPQVVSDQGTAFLRLAADAEDKTVQVRRHIALHPDWAKLTLAARVRYRDIRRGNSTWNDARIVVEFYDQAGKRVGAPAPLAWGKGSSKGGWIDESAGYAIPFGATQVKIEPALLAVTSGTLEIAQLSVTVTDSRSELAKVDILPDSWKPATVPHWREATATREKICLNGVWQFRPIGLADGDPKQVTGGVIASPPLPVDMPDGMGWGYGKVPSTFPGSKESAHEWKMPVGWSTLPWGSIDAVWFRRTIEVPAQWKGRRVLLDIDTPQSQAAVFVGQKLIGRITYPAGVVDLTDAAPAGEKAELTLLVIAKPFSEARVQAMNPNELYLESTDLKQRGLCGDVFLRSEPLAARLTDVQFRPSVRQKQLGLRLTTADLAKPVRVRFEAGSTQWTSEPLTPNEGVITAAVPWMPEKLWDIDAPNLVEAKVSLLDDAGQVIDQVQHRLGFREFWIDGRDLVLNGSPVHLRVTKVASSLAGRSKPQMAGMFRRMRELGFNAAILDYDVFAGSAPTYTPMLEAADETGVLLVFTIPSLLPFKSDEMPDDAKRKSWQTIADYCIRTSRHHPSVIAYSTNHNRLGYHGGLNPDKIDGTHEPTNPDPAFVAKRKLAAELEAYIRSQDPTREVYHHSANNFGAWETNNCYLNWMPIQERADYLERWGTKGVKPLFLTEFGMPFVASWGRYKGPGVYRPTADSEPLFLEYAAALTGARAYDLNGIHDQYVDQYEQSYAKSGKSTWAVLTNPWMRRSTEWNFVEIQARHARQTFPAMRTWGLSAILPWDYKSVATWTDKTPAKVTLTEPAEQWTTPGLHPDFAPGSGYSVDETWFNSPAAETFRLTSLAEAYKRVNADVLAWIAGRPEKFTEVTHVFRPGQGVTKQVIVINDLRRDLKARYTATVMLGDRRIATRTADVTIEPGRQRRDPLPFTIPADATGSGTITLELTYGDGQSSSDSFAFQVVATPAKPQRPGTVKLWDPKGHTAKAMAAIGADVPVIDGTTIPADTTCLLIGREAMTVEGALPDIRPLLARGGRVIVFEQTEAVLSRRLGFRTAVPSMRNVFVRTPSHPAVAGLSDQTLCDWNGQATLIPGKTPGLPAFETKYPTADWLGFRNTRVWKAGNWGQVASVVIEKPQTGDFTAIIDGGFDLQYAPLLQSRVGGGQVLFCQMDLSGRTESDPAADRLLANLLQWSAAVPVAAEAAGAVYVGEAQTQAFLASLGAQVSPGDVPAGGVCVVGPEITRDRLAAMVPAIRKSRATFVFLAASADALAALGEQLTAAPAKIVGDAIVPENAPADLLAGIGPAEMHLRARTTVTGVTPKSGWKTANGMVATASLGEARLVFVQIDPRTFDYRQPSRGYVKLTHNRTRTLLSRVLANAGVPMTSPILDHWTTPATRAEVDLTKVTWETTLDPDNRLTAEQVSAGTDGATWQNVSVPGPAAPDGARGTFWYRVRFDVPAGLTGELLLTLGNVDDEDWTTLNGKLLGHTGKDTHPQTYYKQQRQYRIPADLLKAAGNVLVIKATNFEGPGGILEGPASVAPPLQRWKASYYHDTPVAADDPYRYYRW